MSRKVVLIIMDGWGIATNKSVSAVDLGNTPFTDCLSSKYPHSTLEASGLAVGLPEGQMGNSEVGHMNLGAGRVVYQNLVKISLAAKDGSLAKNPLLVQSFDYAKKNGKKVHFIGLLSDGGVHSHIEHLEGLLDAANKYGLEKVYLHAFMDGRDCDPKSGKSFIQQVEKIINNTPAKIASVIGRYWVMDRDKRWERVKEGYQAMVNGVGVKSDNPVQALQNSYDKDVTDEFIKPIVITENGTPIAKIEDGDVVVNFNFRSDRAREITDVLTQVDMPEYDMKKLKLEYLTMTKYDETFKDVKILYDTDDVTQTLGEVLEKAGKKQLRIAETEKYPHVTFFFSGGREAEFVGESRILCPSPKVATYDLQPEMSAHCIVEKVIPVLKDKQVDFVCLNFANPDMVGHTGDIKAAIKAVETVDKSVSEVTTVALDNDYIVLITADHGNSEYLKNPDGSPNTAHTTNLVPLYLVGKEFEGNKEFNLKAGKLADIAPTILKLMGVAKPVAMTGEELV